jgi:hypothetical protein
MFILNNSPLPIGVPFEHNGIQYPANWLQLSTLEEKTAIGITEVAEQTRPDDRWYYVNQNVDGSYSMIPKDLTALRAQWTQTIDETAWQLLHRTDYMDFRHNSDSGYTPPADWVTWRAAIRSEAKTAKAAIAAATDIPSLQAAVQVSWTPDPNSATK